MAIRTDDAVVHFYTTAVADWNTDAVLDNHGLGRFRVPRDGKSSSKLSYFA